MYQEKRYLWRWSLWVTALLSSIYNVYVSSTYMEQGGVAMHSYLQKRRMTPSCSEKGPLSVESWIGLILQVWEWEPESTVLCKIEWKHRVPGGGLMRWGDGERGGRGWNWTGGIKWKLRKTHSWRLCATFSWDSKPPKCFAGVGLFPFLFFLPFTSFSFASCLYFLIDPENGAVER